MPVCVSVCLFDDDYYHKGRVGGGQGVMIEIILRENDDNDGWPFNNNCQI